MQEEFKILVCKHCRVPVVSRLDLRAILTKEHARSCPRYKRRRKTK